MEIPTGDWYCPRCVTERDFEHLDPRIGKKVYRIGSDGELELNKSSGLVQRCFFEYGEEEYAQPTLAYDVLFSDGLREIWHLSNVDRSLALANDAVDSIRWTQAIAESPGYGYGVDFGLRTDLVPVPLNPNISDASAQVALSSSVFRDTIKASATLLLIDSSEMTASEWLRLLVLLAMKCSSSDVIQNVVNKMENEAAECMSSKLEKVSQISGIQEILPPICEVDVENTDDPTTDAEATPARSTNEVQLITEASVTIADKSTSNALTSNDFSSDVVGCRGSSLVNNVSETEHNPSVENAEDIEIPVESVPDAIVPLTSAFVEKGKRQKAIEDCIASFCIKSQVQVVSASLEEDVLSQAIDTSLSTVDSGVQFNSFCCRQMACDLCGLTDIALGLPLLRVPDEEEWENYFSHASRFRRSHLLARIPLTKEASEKTKLVVLKIVIGGELVSFHDKNLTEIVDGGMLEFVPRSDVGFQDELQFRSVHSLPFVTGSLSAHECCAIAAHNARKDLLVQKYKEQQTEIIEKEAGMVCGRTLEIGRDRFGRSYWRFYSLSDSLFVCEENVLDQFTTGDSSSIWHHFPDAASIASLIVSLKNDAIVRELGRSFPYAHKLVRDGTWSDILLKQRYPLVPFTAEDSDSQPEHREDSYSESASGTDMLAMVSTLSTMLSNNICFCSDTTSPISLQPFKVGDSVLVESDSGSLIWDAKIVAVSKHRSLEPNENSIIEALRVEYKGWSHRFAEWVNPKRVFQTSNARKLAQVGRNKHFYFSSLYSFTYISCQTPGRKMARTGCL